MLNRLGIKKPSAFALNDGAADGFLFVCLLDLFQFELIAYCGAYSVISEIDVSNIEIDG